jgi:hypothetical protein
MKKNIYFTKKNYILVVAGLLISVIGYALMAGGNPENPAEYSDAIFNFRRLTLAPFVVMAGYVVVLFGIIKVYRKNDGEVINTPSETVKPERRKK